ncbi:hypothetical protein EZV62_013986 [Acer yangbiense]|uniref:BHLH domain-containing protein n=1 Tax=Acer yangbiense TaxID=1000413 RepID=A0A5C7HQT4_9ROSI|nr:hypothetical protein EZV62_013986 [Acer yangbiense]
MGDQVYDYDSNSSFLHCNIPPSSSDEISLLLNQILCRSSSSSSPPPPPPPKTATANSSVFAHMGLHSSSSPPQQQLADGSQGPLYKSRRISAVDSLNNVCSAAGGAFLSGNVRVSTGANIVSSSSVVGVSENETNEEHDCESEEGTEAQVDEGPTKAANRTKRSRAAEVHNLSEKRRRSRINEKMKALQNLIPNSNKTDKASMLDEAIEYLKQLQLQVQMLTMKNGLSLHHMCLPGALQPFQFSQMKMGFGGENGSLHTNTTGTLAVNQEDLTQSLLSLPGQCTATNQLQVSNTINSETSFGLDSSIQAQLGPFLLRTSSEVSLNDHSISNPTYRVKETALANLMWIRNLKEMCREDAVSHRQLNVNHSETNPSAAVPLPFNEQDSDVNDCGSLEACVMARSEGENVPSKNLERDLIYTFPKLNWVKNVQMGRSVAGDDFQARKNEISEVYWTRATQLTF